MANFQNRFARTKERLKEYWDTLSIKSVQTLVKNLMIGGLIAIVIGLYILNKMSSPAPAHKAEDYDVQLSSNALNRDLDHRIEKKVEYVIKQELKNELDNYFQQVNDKITGSSEIAEPENKGHESKIPNDLDPALLEPLAPKIESKADFTYPPSPQMTSVTPTNQDINNEVETWVDVGQVNYEYFDTASDNDIEEGSNEKKFAIPPGFMPAKLLVGIRAQTSSNASGQPKPVHFIVQAPATLPNKVKMNLAGCFVIANVWGNLSTERIEAELVSMHCITNDKKTLIEGDIYGYLADSDGQRDMHGRVVSKASALLARQILADVLEGFGEIAEAQASTIQTSALGTVETIDSEGLVKAGAANGVAAGFSRASEFISDLLVQTGPVMESGAAKEVYLMIQKTSYITMKNISLKD